MPVNRSATVEVRGLKELRQKLKDIDLEKDLKKVHHRVADLAVDARCDGGPARRRDGVGGADDQGAARRWAPAST